LIQQLCERRRCVWSEICSR